MATKLAEASARQIYQRAIRRHIRMFWRGQINRIQFATQMTVTLQRAMNKAWAMGMKDVGLKPNEATPQELDILRQMLSRQYPAIQDLGDKIYQNRKEIGGKLGDVFRKARIPMWVARFDDVRERARTTGLADPKLRWVLDPVKDNCRSCLRLNGKVKRRSFWQKHDVRPKATWAGTLPNEKLVCKGYL
jgi:hypothetical protein